MLNILTSISGIEMLEQKDEAGDTGGEEEEEKEAGDTEGDEEDINDDEKEELD